MIANVQELETVLRQVLELKAQRDSLMRDPAANPFQLHVEVTGLEKMAARLQEEIDAFEAAETRSIRAGDSAAAQLRRDALTGIPLLHPPIP